MKQNKINLINRKTLVHYIMEHYDPKWRFHDLLTIINEIPLYKKEDDWILLSERLPNQEEWQKHDCRFILTDENRVYQGWYDYIDHYFIRDFRGIEPIEDNCIIAWMPLPERYSIGNLDQNMKRNQWSITYYNYHKSETTTEEVECYSYDTARKYFTNHSRPLDTLLSIKDANGTEYYLVEENEE